MLPVTPPKPPLNLPVGRFSSLSVRGTCVTLKPSSRLVGELCWSPTKLLLMGEPPPPKFFVVVGEPWSPLKFLLVGEPWYLSREVYPSRLVGGVQSPSNPSLLMGGASNPSLLVGGVRSPPNPSLLLGGERSPPNLLLGGVRSPSLLLGGVRSPLGTPPNPSLFVGEPWSSLSPSLLSRVSYSSSITGKAFSTLSCKLELLCT